MMVAGNHLFERKACDMYESLKGKVCIVTGASSGMGAATAVKLAGLGVKVVVAGSGNVAGGNATVEKIRAAGGEAVYVRCDVSKEEDVKNLVDAAVKTYGRLDLAFNNAGIGPDGKRIPFAPLTEFDTRDFDDILAVNLRGVFLCLKYELRQMMAQGDGGAIVNTSSVGGLRMVPGFGAYGPSKAGINAISQTAALEAGEHGIRVNVVCPGPTKGTVLMDNNLNSNPDPAGFEKVMASNAPLKKLGTTEDIANTVCFLLADESGHITGETFAVCGGMQI